MYKIKLFDEKSGNPLNDNENRAINRQMMRQIKYAWHNDLPRKAKKLDKEEKTYMFALFMYEALTTGLEQTLNSLKNG